VSIIYSLIAVIIPKIEVTAQIPTVNVNIMSQMGYSIKSNKGEINAYQEHKITLKVKGGKSRGKQ